MKIKHGKITMLGVYISSVYAMSHLCTQILITKKMHKDTTREDLWIVTKVQGCLENQIWYAKSTHPTANLGLPLLLIC